MARQRQARFLCIGFVGDSVARITRMTKRRLGELLQAEGLLTEEQVRAGLDEQRKSNLFLGEALVKLGFISEETIALTIVQQFSLPFMSPHQYTITADVLNLFPERMYYEYQFIACDKIGRTLIIVGAGLMNHDVLDELERLTNCKVCQFVSTWKDIRSALDSHAKDLRRDQSSLSSLGSMLLDSGAHQSVQAPSAAHASSAKPESAIFQKQQTPAYTSSSPTPTGLKSAPPTPRLSAQPPSKTPTGKVEIPPGKSSDSARNQVPEKKSTGLLGLFKKS